MQARGDALGRESGAGVERGDDGLPRTAGLHESGGLEPGDRLTDRRATHAEPLLELGVAQPFAGRELAADDRIAQLVVAPVTAFSFSPVEVLDATERGDGGFGSTGR